MLHLRHTLFFVACFLCWKKWDSLFDRKSHEFTLRMHPSGEHVTRTSLIASQPPFDTGRVKITIKIDIAWKWVCVAFRFDANDFNVEFSAMWQPTHFILINRRDYLQRLRFRVSWQWLPSFLHFIFSLSARDLVLSYKVKMFLHVTHPLLGTYM